MKLEEVKRRARSNANDTNVRLSTGAVAILHTETHAYHTPHVDATDIRADKHVAADFTSARNDTLIAAEDDSLIVHGKNNDVSFGSLHSLPHVIDDSTEYSSDVNHDRLTRKAEQINYEIECAKDQWKDRSRQYARRTNDDTGHETASICTSTNADHVYEEVRTTKEPCSLYNIQDYYERYRPTAAETLIDTLFLSRHQICKECAEIHHQSPVYTDRLIYARKPLFAVEVVLCHRDDVSCFTHHSRRDEVSPILCSRYNADRDRDRMLVYSYVKTNAAGIFYSHRWPRDVFDLESVLKPSIYVISRACNVVVNTQLYHRYVNNYHVRISRTGCAPMTFRQDCGTMVGTRRISCNDDLQNSLNYRRHRLKSNDNDEHRQDRSSLLLLEPLLLVPELASSEQHGKNKNPVLRSERTKVIKLLIAYVLSFFVLTSITFYVVYFT